MSKPMYVPEFTIVLSQQEARILKIALERSLVKYREDKETAHLFNGGADIHPESAIGTQKRLMCNLQQAIHGNQNPNPGCAGRVTYKMIKNQPRIYPC